jgi:archaellum component FlaG (FlaF/FlaG flagellin family)
MQQIQQNFMSQTQNLKNPIKPPKKTIKPKNPIKPNTTQKTQQAEYFFYIKNPGFSQPCFRVVEL